MIKEWLEEYNPATQQEAEQALREIMQEIALAGLQRSGFFEQAAFYGGTALRIFHGLDRFSEDLDFSLLRKDPGFSLDPYLDGMVREFEALGIEVSVKEKEKTNKNAIDSAFLKPGTTWKELVLRDIVREKRSGNRPDISIKIEVDTNPPLGFTTEEKLSVKPFSFYTKCFTLPDLFAGKMHALLFRKWIGRVKGRDWYDMEWYIKKGVPLNLGHLTTRAIDSGDWKEKEMTGEQFSNLLQQKIGAVSFNSIKEDIVKFIKNDQVIEMWSPGYFLDLAGKIKFTR